MLIYRYILESLKDWDADGWGVLNHTLEMQETNLKTKLARLEINHNLIN